MLRPSTRAGRPALGMALIGLVVSAAIFSTVSSITFGPAEQFRPITSTGHSSQAAREGLRFRAVAQVPIIVDGHLRDDTISGPAASRAAKMASRSSSRL